MQTVDKAMELLGIFSPEQPEIGLSDLARSAQFDKATTRRLLLALVKHGVVEQNEETRQYRLGPGVLRLARLREATTPLDSIVRPVLARLVDQTGETAHFVVNTDRDISTIAVVESPKSNRVSMGEGEILPRHATATGIAMLAFSTSAFVDGLLARDLAAYTDYTVTDVTALRKWLARTRKNGFSINKEGYEPDVCSLAAAVFDAGGSPVGAVAVAAPVSRFGASTKTLIRDVVTTAALDITHALGGEPPAALAHWRKDTQR